MEKEGKNNRKFFQQAAFSLSIILYIVVCTYKVRELRSNVAKSFNNMWLKDGTRKSSEFTRTVRVIQRKYSVRIYHGYTCTVQ